MPLKPSPKKSEADNLRFSSSHKEIKDQRVAFVS
jgi:hypothetical protein